MNFTPGDTQTLLDIMRSRRDVRGNSFLATPLEEEKIELILQAALAAPSVGYSQPWEFILINDTAIKEKIHKNFCAENEKAKEIFAKKEKYRELKLEGIREAPLNIAVLYSPRDEPVLGTTSMQKMGEYSVVCAIENMWLMARSLDIGMGWVSILNEKSLLKTLNAPPQKQLIAYLCLGYVSSFASEPELKTLKWEKEKQRSELLHRNRYNNPASSKP
jgi:5,6-dimethylbenzimidazole synthase